MVGDIGVRSYERGMRYDGDEVWYAMMQWLRSASGKVQGVTGSCLGPNEGLDIRIWLYFQSISYNS